MTTYLFNGTSAGLATWATGMIVALLLAEPINLAIHPSGGTLFAAVCLMALTQYLFTTSLIAILQSLKMAQSVWIAWRNYYLWTSITYFVGAFAAGIIIYFFTPLTATNAAGIFVVAPIIIIVYLTYTSYLKNLDALQESEIRFRSSFDYATIGMALVSREGKWLQVNSSLCQFLGLQEAELLASNYDQVVYPPDLQTISEQLQQLTEGKLPAFQTEVRFLEKSGKSAWVLLGVSVATDAQGQVRYLIFQIQDINSRKLAQESLLYDAYHDALTKLPNRAAYKEALIKALPLAKKSKNLLAVLFLDLDGFKIVNDSLGHAVGDNLLIGVSARLLECVRAEDTVARLGGDEFTILLENLQTVEQAEVVANRIIQRLSEPFQLAGQEVFVGTSIGIATSEIDYFEAGDILRDADAAMYQAKSSGKGCYAVFDNKMHENAVRVLWLANDLRRAIERSELIIHFQPIQSLESGKISGLEALVRWKHPTFGMLPPAEFISLAEENGLISAIDNWTLMMACRQMKLWQEYNPDFTDLAVSVNISPKQFAQMGLTEYVKRMLHETELPPNCLQLEITESAMVKNLKNTARILEELSALGVRIALDDFGTGYSSLSYLHELPLSTLKIDRSFVRRLDAENDGTEIVRAIVNLARSLKMSVVAEGIETEVQLHQLREMGCDFGQGYFLSRPIEAREVPKFVQTSLRQPAFNEINTPRNHLRLIKAG